MPCSGPFLQDNHTKLCHLWVWGSGIKAAEIDPSINQLSWPMLRRALFIQFSCLWTWGGEGVAQLILAQMWVWFVIVLHIQLLLSAMANSVTWCPLLHFFFYLVPLFLATSQKHGFWNSAPSSQLLPFLFQGVVENSRGSLITTLI